MKTIRLTYQCDDIELSLPLLLFFKMIGLHIIERFSYPTFDFRKEFALIGAKRMNPEWNPWDVDIILINSETGYYDYEDEFKEALVVIDENINIPNSYITYHKEQEIQLLFDVISELQRMRKISSSEARALKKLVEVLGETQYFPLFLKCEAMTTKIKNNCNIKDPNEIRHNIHSWREIIDTLLSLLKDLGVQRWGESKGERIQFAIANISYELDIYCKRMGEPLEITPESLLSVCQYMDNFQDDSLQIALMTLRAKCYMDLIGDMPKGYDYLESICDQNGDYNAEAYFLRGNYWLSNAKNYKVATKYYVSSLERFSEDYRVWYRLGVAYYKTEEKRKALAAFEAVVKILKPRFMKNKLRVYESERLFLSYRYSGNIYFNKNNDLRNAISCYKYAQMVYENISESTFYADAKISEADVNNIRKMAESSLEIKEIEEQLQYWQKLAVLKFGATV